MALIPTGKCTSISYHIVCDASKGQILKVGSRKNKIKSRKQVCQLSGYKFDRNEQVNVPNHHRITYFLYSLYFILHKLLYNIRSKK